MNAMNTISDNPFARVWFGHEVRPDPQELAGLMRLAQERRQQLPTLDGEKIDAGTMRTWWQPTGDDCLFIAKEMRRKMLAAATEGNLQAALFSIPLGVFDHPGLETVKNSRIAIPRAEAFWDEFRATKTVTKTGLYEISPPLLKYILEAHEATAWRTIGGYYGLQFLGSGNSGTGPKTSITVNAEWLAYGPPRR
jgi:hypothetical protein